MTTDTTPGGAPSQGMLWNERADDSAAIQEHQVRPAFGAALEILGADARMLDVGCGAGLALRLAVDRGAEVACLDASEALLVPGYRISNSFRLALATPTSKAAIEAGLQSTPQGAHR